jgi:mono/diheme cytochrome c family protein
MSRLGKATRSGVLGILSACIVSAAPAPQPPAAVPDVAPVPDLKMRTPAEEMAATQLQPGYHLELVASDPDIISPVLCTWDGDGRMYVAQMRSYMLDINGANEKTPNSRVTRLEDVKGDGSYAKHTVFADGLVLPRMVLPLDDRILIRETDTKDIYSYRDTKGTGVADEKKPFYIGGPRGGNLEHQPSGLIWDIDNWVYQTAEAERFRYKDGKFEMAKLPYGTGQWGVAMDDTGRLIFASAGAERPAHDFQVPMTYGRISLRDEVPTLFTEVYPRLKLTDVQGGPKRLWPGGGLNHFTGCAGPSIYRGDALPRDLYGDYIVPEPVGRLIRRAKVTHIGGLTSFVNAYDHAEFINSLDPNFRPVWTATGPDGCLYICDMYHGIIQESSWTKEGSFLRPQIQKYGLDKHINAGRIYRVVYDGMKPRRDKPHMLSETPAQLVAHLSDPNGWWRDTAQKLLVIRGDKSVVPALEELALTSQNPIARLHAIWTLDGLESTHATLLAELLKDKDGRVRSAAIRISEPLIQKGDPAILAVLKGMASDAQPEVVEQFCLSMLATKNPAGPALAKQAVDANAKYPAVGQIVTEFNDFVSGGYAAKERAKNLFKKEPKLAALYLKGRENFSLTCIACHGLDGKGTPAPGLNGITLGPPLAGSKRLQGDKDLVVRIALHGLQGPNNGKQYPGEMVGFPWADDQWLSSILTYARNDWGNKASPILPDEVAKIRKASAVRVKPYTTAELPNGKWPKGVE